jgi:hypothetical protein
LTVNAPWLELVKTCVETSDINKRVEILQRIISVESMIKLPTFITNDYIDKTLDLLDERLNSRDNLKVDANYKDEIGIRSQYKHDDRTVV